MVVFGEKDEKCRRTSSINSSRLQAAHGKGSNRRKRENNVLFLKFIHL
jgi:hypothetical protein